MEEFFVHKCVTADALPLPPTGTAAAAATLSTWSQSARCELVVVQENQQARGASRAVLAAIVGLTLESRKTSRVLLFTLDSLRLADSARASEKLVLFDFASDTSLLRTALLGAKPPLSPSNGQPSSPAPAPPNTNTQLLSRLQRAIDAQLAIDTKQPSTAAARSIVVVFDSVNALLMHHSLSELLLFLHQLRTLPSIGSVIVRLSASAAAPAVRLALAAASTAVAVVETPMSLSAYPILAKERRREVPKDMHGLVLLLRYKKNGRSSESVDYFQVHGDRMQFVPAAQLSEPQQQQQKQSAPTTAGASTGSRSSEADPLEAAATSSASHERQALPVRQEDVSFNLSISVEEQLAKNRVQLPYMHQGQSSAASSASSVAGATQPSSSSAATNLFFIDDDDPDWDDDDLDDDLDI